METVYISHPRGYNILSALNSARESVNFNYCTSRETDYSSILFVSINIFVIMLEDNRFSADFYALPDHQARELALAREAKIPIFLLYKRKMDNRVCIYTTHITTANNTDISIQGKFSITFKEMLSQAHSKVLNTVVNTDVPEIGKLDVGPREGIINSIPATIPIYEFIEEDKRLLL